MALSLTGNLVIGLLDAVKIPVPRELGVAILVSGSTLFVYALLYLRSSFIGETEIKLLLFSQRVLAFLPTPTIPKLHHNDSRNDPVFRSVLGIVCTLALSTPTVIHRARVEDRLL
jgi:hypothetical protein